MNRFFQSSNIKIILKHGTTTEECECTIYHKQSIGKLLKKYRRFYEKKKINYRDCYLFDYSAHVEEVISMFPKASGFDGPKTLLIFEKKKMKTLYPDKFMMKKIPESWLEKGCQVKLLRFDTLLGEVILEND